MHAEFERLAGYKVDLETYNCVIEPMYMATNLTKEDFIKCLNRKAFEVEEPIDPRVNEWKEQRAQKRALLKEKEAYLKSLKEIGGFTFLLNCTKYEIKKLKAEIKELNFILG